MAPARMMQFVDKHVRDCAVCAVDPDLPREVEKIREFVLPESKIPKAIREQQDVSPPEISPDDEEDDERGEGDDDNDNDEDDI